MRLPTWPLSSAATRASVIVSSRDRLADRLVGPGRSSGRTPPEWPLGSGRMDVDVVVVSYRSGKELRACVEPLAAAEGIHVTVVDNASGDGSLDAVAGLDVRTIALPDNRGFAAGCNAGWRAGSSPYVLFLNPDARIDAGGRRDARRSARARARRGASPRRGSSTTTGRSTSRSGASRRCARPTRTRSSCTDCSARADWASELVRDPADYERPGSPEWASGACLLVRRAVLEELGGWDEGFFMYCEDKDLCRRARDAGLRRALRAARRSSTTRAARRLRARQPRARARGEPGAVRAQAPRPRRRRARAGRHRAHGAHAHRRSPRGGRAARAGHAAALRAALRPARAS